MIKSTLYLSVFIAFFMLVMRKTTFLRLNRIAFLAGTFICLALPFIKIDMPENVVMEMPMAIIENALSPAVVTSAELGGAVVSATERTAGMTLPVISIILLAGMIVSLFITARSYFLMTRMLRSVPVTMIDGTPVRITDVEIPSFSWGRHIVISRKDLEENLAILTHEKMHVRCGHSIDLMAYALVTVMHWFNPLVWIARTELKMLHEYEADDLTINKGIDATQYQLLLVKKAVGAKRFQLANGFNHSKLKNRITMMQKTKTNRWMSLAYLLCIPALIGAMCCCAQSTQRDKSVTADTGPKEVIDTTKKTEPVPFQFVEVKPTFNGGDANTFSKWVNEQLVYPENCLKEGISGMVTLTFTVSETGKVTDIKVLRGAHADLDKEAARVLGLSPEWTPGSVDGKPVAVSYTFPVIFQTKKTDDKTDVVPFQLADTKPGFNGGDANEFSKWVAEHMTYPENCKKEGIEGRVTLSFTVTETGKVTDVKVLRGVHTDLDNEAIRVISSAPDWTPGLKDGKAVPVSYTFPVIFKAN